MRQLVLVVDSQCFVASIYALDVRMAKPLLNGRFFTRCFGGEVFCPVLPGILACHISAWRAPER